MSLPKRLVYITRLPFALAAAGQILGIVAVQGAIPLLQDAVAFDLATDVVLCVLSGAMPVATATVAIWHSTGGRLRGEVIPLPPSAAISLWGLTWLEPLLTGGCKWTSTATVDGARDPRHHAYGGLYAEYRTRCAWFLAVDVLTATLATALSSIRTTSRTICDIIAGLLLLLNVIMVVVFLVVRPCLSPLKNWQTALTATLSAIAGGLAYGEGTREAAVIVGITATGVQLPYLVATFFVTYLEQRSHVKALLEEKWRQFATLHALKAHQRVDSLLDTPWIAPLTELAPSPANLQPLSGTGNTRPLLSDILDVDVSEDGELPFANPLDEYLHAVHVGGGRAELVEL